MDIMDTFVILLCTAASYLIGSIPTGLVLARAFGRQDLRTSGSGNIGATNAARVLGKKFGALTFAGDVLKAIIPMVLGRLLIAPALNPFAAGLAVGLFGFAAFVGHLYPVYLRFRGGKGIATGFGIFVYLEPGSAAVALAVFVLIVAASKYVSLGSIIAAVLLPVILIIDAWLVRPVFFPYIIMSMLMAVLIVIKHRANIQRLFSGTEHAIGSQKKNPYGS